MKRAASVSRGCACSLSRTAWLDCRSLAKLLLQTASSLGYAYAVRGTMVSLSSHVVELGECCAHGTSAMVAVEVGAYTKCVSESMFQYIKIYHIAASSYVPMLLCSYVLKVGIPSAAVCSRTTVPMAVWGYRPPDIVVAVAPKGFDHLVPSLW